jgi:phosphoribosylformylglycinamidine synthase I
MKFGVVIFPGSNCDQDMIHVLRNVLQQEVEVLWHKDPLPAHFSKKDCVVLPGGFSYGDYLRSGAIARFSPIMESVIEHARNGGFVFGVCNGFQILCESHLLPGALLRNTGQTFLCKNVFIRPATLKSPITRNLSLHKAYKIPIAHAEGRYYADNATIQSLKKNEQILFRYCDAFGRVSEESNPNGSIENIAGICNAERNVFGMMPHPERAAESVLGNEDGKALLESLTETVIAQAV